MNCTTCQDLLFDFVYGLLDEPEAMAVRDHVAACPACTAALAKAKGDQQKLSQAALAIAQVPPFQMPSERAPAQTVPAAPPTVEPPKKQRVRSLTIVAWIGTLACCALVAVLLAFNHRRQMAEQETIVADLSRQDAAIEAKLASLNANVAASQRELPQSLNKEVRQLHLSGPGQVTPGASAGYQVAIRDLDGAPRAANVDVSWVDSKNVSVAKQSLNVKGVAEIPVPTELEKNHGSIRMKVVAKDVGAIEETVESQAPGLAAHIAVNKLLFKPGERVQVRTLALDRVTLKPAPAGTKLGVSLLAENGQAVAPALELTTLAGMAAGEIALPANLAEGVYVLETRGARLATAHRRIEVLPTVAPPVDVITQNNRFRNGEPIKQEVQLYLSNGAPARNVPVFGNTNVAETNNNARGNNDAPQQRNQAQNGYTFQGNTDEAGRVQIKSPAPADVRTGRQLWQADLSYGAGKKEKASVQRELQVQPSRVVVEFFPEGGHLIAAVPNRVFYRVRAPEDGAAAEARIAIESSKGRVFDSIKEPSFGSFEFTPDPSETYVLKVLSPKQADVVQPFANFGVQSEGLLLRGEVVQDGAKPLDLVLVNRGPERLVQVIATCRGQIVYHDRVAVAAGRTPLTIASPVDGLVRVTALEAKDGQLVPLTERLFFRTPARRLELTVDANAEKNVAGPVQITVKARDERQQPTACWSLANVVDDRFRGDVPEPTLAAHFLLLGDAPADVDLSELPLVALDGQTNRADLELILGVYGWRRVSGPAPNPTMMAKNLRDGMAKAGEDRQAKNDKQQEARAPGGSTFFYRVAPSGFELQQKIEQMRQKLNQENDLAQIALIGAANSERAQLLSEKAKIGQRLTNARTEFAELSRRPLQQLMEGLGLLTLGLLVAGVLLMGFGLIRLVRRRPAAMSFGVACGCLAICLALMVSQPQRSVDERMPAVAVHADKTLRGDFKVEPRIVALNEKKKSTPRTTDANLELDAGKPMKELERVEKAEAQKAEKADRDGNDRRLGDGVVPGEQVAQLDRLKQMIVRGFKNAEARAQSPVVANPQSVALVRQQPGAAAPFTSSMTAPVSPQVSPQVSPAPPAAPGAGFGGAGLAPAAALPPMAGAKNEAKKAASLPQMEPMPVGDAKGLQPKIGLAKDAMASALKDGAAKDRSGKDDKAGGPRGDALRAQDPALEQLAKKLAASDKGQRVDLAELNRQFGARRAQDIEDPATILWNPALRVPVGGISLGIDLPVGRYRVLFFGHTEDGRLGVYDGILSAK